MGVNRPIWLSSLRIRELLKPNPILLICLIGFTSSQNPTRLKSEWSVFSLEFFAQR